MVALQLCCKMAGAEVMVTLIRWMGWHKHRRTIRLSPTKSTERWSNAAHQSPVLLHSGSDGTDHVQFCHPRRQCDSSLKMPTSTRYGGLPSEPRT